MPPSGYSAFQAQHIALFLASCGKALVTEAKASGLSLDHALRSEIASIDSILPQLQPEGVQTAVLALTRSYYQALLNNATGASLADKENGVLRAIIDAIQAIHVPS